MHNKSKILIVEDEGALLQVLSDKLTREGFLVAKARDGQEGLMEVKKSCPDLILLDIIMPAMDGVSMLKQLRQNKDTENIPVIIISNLSEIEKITSILQAKKGVVEHIIKSNWSMAELVDKIKKNLDVYHILKEKSQA